jgi:hypothetical protein
MNPPSVGSDLMEAAAGRNSNSKYLSSHLDIFWESHGFLSTKSMTYAYGSSLTTLHRIQKLPAALYPIPYFKTQNIVKLKKPVISMTPVA